MSEGTVELGKSYMDSITGVTGVATSRTEYLYGCVRVSLESGAEGKLQAEWFDEQRLVHVESGEPVEPSATSGGDRPAPPLRDPVR